MVFTLLLNVLRTHQVDLNLSDGKCLYSSVAKHRNMGIGALTVDVYLHIKKDEVKYRMWYQEEYDKRVAAVLNADFGGEEEIATIVVRMRDV
jgi:hypothetical protein